MSLQSEPVSLQLESFIPSDCSDCENAMSKCLVLARRIISGQIGLADAGMELRQDLSENCSGGIVRPSGWGTNAKSCKYEKTI